MKWRIGLVMGIITLCMILPAFKGRLKDPMEYYRPYVLTELENSIKWLQVIQKNKNDSAAIKKAYHQSRKHYKHVECFVEYCSPREAKFGVNGALVPKNDPEFGSKVFYPKGFQTVEESIFGSETLDTVQLEKRVAELILQLDVLKKNYKSIQVENEQLLDVFQYQLYRIAALNLNGYDATFTQTNITEIKYCIEGLEELTKAFEKYKKTSIQSNIHYKNIQIMLGASKKYLTRNSNYISFNRLAFIKYYLLPLNEHWVKFHNATTLPWDKTKKALNLEVANLFSEESLNIRFFSTSYGDTLRLNKKQALGEKLFFDPELSGNGKRSCATCHNPDKAFTDGLPKSKHFDEQAELERNAPTLLNVIYQRAFFYDGRSIQLEQQIFEVVHNKNEMDGNIQIIVQKLQKSNEYKKMFTDAFYGTKDTLITPYAALIAIAEYEKTLTSMKSRFDQYIAGNEMAMNKREVNGYNLFAGKALCGSCHFFPLFNGTVPPNFIDAEFEVLGTPSTTENKELDKDPGRYALTKLDMHKNSFKTPTVRNVELTAPYMHNGIYNTLEEVIEFYHKGGGVGLGYEVPNQTLPFDSLVLTKTEKEDIVLFLNSLTDNKSYKNN